MPNCISVPINNEAMIRLDYDQCLDGDLIEVILNDKEYNELCNTQLIEKINETLSKKIDDYEDENILDINELKITKKIIEHKLDEYDSEVLKKLLFLIEKAIIFKTGIFFFF